MRKKLLYCEIFGFFFIFILGALWHFLYGWSGDNALVALVAPVNESVWEHFKIGIYPALLFALPAYYFIGQYRRHYWVVRALQLYLIPFFIALLFYGYTAILGTNKLFLDILLFAVTVAAVQFIGFKLLIRAADPGWTKFIAFLSIAVLLTAIAVFTVHPLPLPVFME